MTLAVTALRLIVIRVGLLVVLMLWLPELRRTELIVCLLILSGWMIAELLSEHEAANRAAVRSPEDRNSRYVVLGAHLISWWLPFIEISVAPTQVFVPRAIAGVVMVAAGAALRLVAVRTLGEYFTAHVRVVDGQVVCRSGIYALIRHPSYVGLFLLNLGPSVAGGTWISLGIAMVLTMASNWVRVEIEEQALTARLGARYVDYCRTVPRWVPRAWGTE